MDWIDMLTAIGAIIIAAASLMFPLGRADEADADQAPASTQNRKQP